MRVAELMTTDVATCTADDTLARAAQLMWDRDCGCVPIVDEEGRVAAIVTDRDICMAALTQGRPLERIRAWTAASHQVFVVHADDPLEAARELIGRKQVRRLPVVDENEHLVGIVSLSDLATHTDCDELRAARIADVLAAVSMPRAHAQH